VIDRSIDIVAVFSSQSTQNRSFRRRFPKPISWLNVEKLNSTQQKHAFANHKNALQHKINAKKLKPGLVAFHDIRFGNGVGLFSKGKDK